MSGAHTPIRVLFCHFTADIAGGSDRSLFDIVTHLPRDTFTPVMVLKKADPLAPKYRDAGVTVHEITLVPPRRALEPLKLLRYALFFFPSAFRIRRIIRTEQIHLVHVNTLYNLQGALAARLEKRPLVWHIRELIPGSRVVQFFLGCARRWATRVIANSRAVAQTVTGCGDRVQVVYNGIDLSEYETLPDGNAVREALGAPADAPVVAVIGRIEPWKGQHVPVEAVPEILKEHANAELWIVGGAAVNKPEYLATIKERVAALGITDRVRFTGIRDDIPAVLAAADVLVLPSVTPEPFGRTIVEAMAARVPVIATNHGGPTEIIEHEKTGLLIPPDDPAALATAINTLLRDPDRAQRIAAAARAAAREKFSIDRLITDMTRLLTATANRG